jgi:hypothetical protein
MLLMIREVTFAWSTLFNNGNWALRGQMNAAIKRHDLFDGGLAEFDVVGIMFQQCFNCVIRNGNLPAIFCAHSQLPF